MRLLVPLAVLMALLAIGCKSGKAAKCSKAFDQMKAMSMGLAKMFGGGDALEKMMAKVKDPFMDKCKALPDDAVACLSDVKKSMADPKCRKVLRGLRKTMRPGRPG